jgi:hypothetical protein
VGTDINGDLKSLDRPANIRQQDPHHIPEGPGCAPVSLGLVFGLLDACTKNQGN